MITETTVEWYRFTCTHCSAWWIAHYEVSRAIDDVMRSFYRYHRLPCEAPAHAVIVCPMCHHTSVQAKLLDHPAAETAPQRPLATQPYDGEVADWTGRHFKFKALVSLDPPVGDRPAGPYPSGTQSLLVRASSLSTPHLHMYFPAATFTNNGQPLKPGDRNVVVTIMVPDHDASEFFGPGRHIVLWNGSEVGHGTVSRRVFNWPELG